MEYKRYENFSYAFDSRPDTFYSFLLGRCKALLEFNNFRKEYAEHIARMEFKLQSYFPIEDTTRILRNIVELYDLAAALESERDDTSPRLTALLKSFESDVVLFRSLTNPIFTEVVKMEKLIEEHSFDLFTTVNSIVRELVYDPENPALYRVLVRIALTNERTLIRNARANAYGSVNYEAIKKLAYSIETKLMFL